MSNRKILFLPIPVEFCEQHTHTHFSSASQNNYFSPSVGGKNPLNHEYSMDWLMT